MSEDIKDQVELGEDYSYQYDDAYMYKLDNFEGPLDLLLEIIKKKKMDIMEVQLSEITGQYLKYMRDVETLDMDKASEFILMASTLIDIKSREALPRIEEDNEEGLDEGMLLKLRLQEYKLFKEQAETLKLQENVNHFYRLPDENVGEPRFVMKDMVMDNLLDAFVKLMTKVDKKLVEEKPKEIVRDRFTVAEKIASAKNILKEKKVVDFTELFEEGQTKSELINIFLALLELLKIQFAYVEQNGLFANIKIHLNENYGVNNG